MLKSLFCLSALIVCYLGVVAQAKVFVPAKEDPVLLTNLLNEYQQAYTAESERFPVQYRKDYQKVYDERWTSIKEIFDKQEIYTSLPAQQYLNSVVNEIVKDNAVLKGRPFHCYFSRSSIPNASYMGEGIILVNMGLFYRLTDESQVAFVLCHEISHYLLRHQEKSIDKYVAAINSPEVQAQLRKIKGSEYKKLEQLEILVKGLAFDSRRHSRDHESEADSMAVELMRGTPFALSGAVTTLALLDTVDEDRFDTEDYLRQTFNASDYPFQKKWLAWEAGLLGGHALLDQDEMTDSLKTHPDCQLRMRLIGPMTGMDGARAGMAGIGSGMPGRPGRGRVFVVDSVAFRALQEQFRYEVIEYAYSSGGYTQSFYLALKLLQNRPSDAYAVAQIGRVLNGIYNAQKAHTLGKVVELPAPYYPANYNALLQFVQNLYLEDLASISYYFLRAHRPDLDGYALFKKTYEESAILVAQE